jgi:hypothetical protein
MAANTNKDRVISRCCPSMIEKLFLSLDYSKKPQGRNLKCQIFKIVLHWCLDLICHNVGTSLKHYKHIFDIPHF